ncbi:uncharacterized protein LOC110013854 [Oryzias latipes]
MLSWDRSIVHNNIAALCLMFKSYFCFNSHYPTELASTLEFLQRDNSSVSNRTKSLLSDTISPQRPNEDMAYVLRCATLPGWEQIEEAKLKKAFVSKCRAEHVLRPLL